jgi:CMP-N-acetylneuraminic acid synthetase
MSKWILDIQSGTLVDAENCVIFDDSVITDYTNVDDEEDFIDYAEKYGKPVLNYRNPEEVHTVWCADDVQELCMNLTDAEALEALQKVSKVLHELSISYGWEILETALASEGYEITMDKESE